MRVIAGAAKGRRLSTPTGSGTRPMTGKAKEGIFSAIAADVPDACVVDLYAGSGSMGLEALSRGAASAVFVERERAALASLRDNIDAVGLGGSVFAADVVSFLNDGARGRTFDLAFVDPPYDLSLASVLEVLSALVDCLRDGALVVVHRRFGEPRPRVPGLILVGERTYGTARIWRFRAVTEGEDDEHDDEEQG